MTETETLQIEIPSRADAERLAQINGKQYDSLELWINDLIDITISNWDELLDLIDNQKKATILAEVPSDRVEKFEDIMDEREFDSIEDVLSWTICAQYINMRENY